MKRSKGYFSISAVAKMFSVHQQTIRWYEKEGLVAPKRSDGNTRLFSESDVDKLEQIIYLTHELGINIAGVEMILKLQRQMKKMQNEMNKIFQHTQTQLEKESEIAKKLAKISAQRLIKIKSETKTTKASSKDEETVDIDDWQVEYDE